MKDQIKELRVKIDGLGYLIKTLQGFAVDLAYAKENENLFTFFKRAKSDGFAVDLPLSDQLKKVYDSLLMAKKWLGEVYIIIGVELTKDVAPKYFGTGTQIPTIDGGVELNWDVKNYVGKVLWLHHEISEIIKKLPDYDEFYGKASDEAKRSISYEKREVGFDKLKPLLDAIPDWSIEIQNVFTNLTEAMFNLEFELQRINES